MSKLIKNWSYLLASDVIQQLVGFAIVILLARKLSPDGFGMFNVLISIATIFSVISNFGMSNVIIRELSLKPETTTNFVRKIVIPLRILSFFTAIISYFIYNSITLTVDNEWTLYVVLIVLNISLWDFSESIAFGHEVTKYSSILNILISIGWLFSILLIPENLFSVNTIILIYCLIHFIKAATYVFIVYRNYFVNKSIEFENETLSRLDFFKMILPYIWLLFIVTLGNQLPIQFLSLNSSLNEVGFYAVGFKLMIPISIAVGTAFKAFFPAFTKLYSTNKSDFEDKIKLGFNLIVVLGTVIAIVTSLTSEYWLPIIFGTKYDSVVIVFNFLIWFSVLSVLDTLLSNGFSSAYKEKVLATLATIDVLILLPLLYYASSFGAWGLALLKLIAGIFFVGFHFYIFIKKLKVKIFNKDLFILLCFYFVSLTICLLIDSKFYQILFLSLLFVVIIKLENSPIDKVVFMLKYNISKLTK